MINFTGQFTKLGHCVSCERVSRRAAEYWEDWHLELTLYSIDFSSIHRNRELTLGIDGFRFWKLSKPTYSSSWFAPLSPLKHHTSGKRNHNISVHSNTRSHERARTKPVCSHCMCSFVSFELEESRMVWVWNRNYWKFRRAPETF